MLPLLSRRARDFASRPTTRRMDDLLVTPRSTFTPRPYFESEQAFACCNLVCECIRLSRPERILARSHPRYGAFVTFAASFCAKLGRENERVTAEFAQDANWPICSWKEKKNREPGSGPKLKTEPGSKRSVGLGLESRA
ncbi:hypothetical protein EVAR_39050_1 [Eumeta japonica]|uniref:Uncharacterized protein n=1 Tax=Eumeta variegata TaxID=151549 RepID=A0A4C1WM92_EUMVA|nr:hypothetical protein EVAR_39050_1 [Eumeta japonica]